MLWGARVTQQWTSDITGQNSTACDNRTLSNVYMWPRRDLKDSHTCTEDSWNFPLPLCPSCLSSNTLLFPTPAINPQLKKPIGETFLSFTSCLLAWHPCHKTCSLCKIPLPRGLVFCVLWATSPLAWFSGHVNPGSLIPGLSHGSVQVGASSQQCLRMRCLYGLGGRWWFTALACLSGRSFGLPFLGRGWESVASTFSQTPWLTKAR